MRIKRVLDATLILVTDNFINYVSADSSRAPKLVNFARIETKELRDALEIAIRQGKSVELLIERKEKEDKRVDYVIEVQ